MSRRPDESWSSNFLVVRKSFPVSPTHSDTFKRVPLAPPMRWIFVQRNFATQRFICRRGDEFLHSVFPIHKIWAMTQLSLNSFLWKNNRAQRPCDETCLHGAQSSDVFLDGLHGESPRKRMHIAYKSKVIAPWKVLHEFLDVDCLQQMLHVIDVLAVHEHSHVIIVANSKRVAIKLWFKTSCQMRKKNVLTSREAPWCLEPCRIQSLGRGFPMDAVEALVWRSSSQEECCCLRKQCSCPAYRAMNGRCWWSGWFPHHLLVATNTAKNVQESSSILSWSCKQVLLQSIFICRTAAIVFARTQLINCGCAIITIDLKFVSHVDPSWHFVYISQQTYDLIDRKLWMCHGEGPQTDRKLRDI